MDKMAKRNDESEQNTQQQALVGKFHAAALDDAAWPRLGNDIALAFDAAGNIIVSMPSCKKTQLLGNSRLLNVFHVLGSVFPLVPDKLGIDRARVQHHYSPQDKWQAQNLPPHWQRAMQIRQRLARGSAGTRYRERLLDTLDLAVLMLNADGNILFANSLALLLFGHKTPGPAARAGVPRQLDISRETLRQQFDLTPGESQVGLALANGASLAEIAGACGVSVNTVKTHLRHIFGKTGTCRQGELIALLHRCSPGPTPF